MTHFDCMLACLWQFQATKDLFVGYQKSLGGAVKRRRWILAKKHQSTAKDHQTVNKYDKYDNWKVILCAWSRRASVCLPPNAQRVFLKCAPMLSMCKSDTVYWSTNWVETKLSTFKSCNFQQVALHLVLPIPYASGEAQAQIAARARPNRRDRRLQSLRKIKCISTFPLWFDYYSVVCLILNHYYTCSTIPVDAQKQVFRGRFCRTPNLGVLVKKGTDTLRV